MPAYMDPAPLGVDEPGDGVEQRRLADAVAPDEGVHAALGDPQVDVEQDLDRPVAEVEIRRRRAGRRPPLPSGRAGRARSPPRQSPAPSPSVGPVAHRRAVACRAVVRSGPGSIPSSASASARTISRRRRSSRMYGRTASSSSRPDTRHQRDQDRGTRSRRPYTSARTPTRVGAMRRAHALQHDVDRRAPAAQPGVQHVGACRVHRRLRARPGTSPRA